MTRATRRAGGVAPGARPCPSPGSPWTSRSPTSTGRSTTGCPRTSTRRRRPACGCGSGSPGRLVDGFLLERVAESDHVGRLAWVDKVVSPEPVLTAEVAALCRAVADRYAGVLGGRPAPGGAAAARAGGGRGRAGPRPTPGVGGRPARRARGDRAGAGRSGPGGRSPARTGRRPGPAIPAGPALLDALAGGRAAHAVWQALPGESWADRLAEAAPRPPAAGRGALLVVPDQRDVAALHAACTARLGAAATSSR